MGRGQGCGAACAVMAVETEEEPEAVDLGESTPDKAPWTSEAATAAPSWMRTWAWLKPVGLRFRDACRDACRDTCRGACRGACRDTCSPISAPPALCSFAATAF